MILSVTNLFFFFCFVSLKNKNFQIGANVTADLKFVFFCVVKSILIKSILINNSLRYEYVSFFFQSKYIS